MAAPISPPNNACEELEGRPSNQVSRFHTMPPTRPANTMSNRACPAPASSSGRGAPERSWIFTTALVTVSATCTDKKAPTRFSTAESATAILGRSAPVAMEVAIAFAVSWKPLVKSKANAVTTTNARMTKLAVTPAILTPR